MRNVRNIVLVIETLTVLLGVGCASRPSGASWPQWRGPGRNGLAEQSPPLIERLPEGGLAPAWASEPFPSMWDGGWGCPVVSGGRVYMFVQTRDLRPGVVLEPQKYPWKPQESTPDAEYAEYEVKRRDEEEVRAKDYAFYETILCFDEKTGATLWKHRRESVYTRFMQCGTPVVDGGRVYVLGAGRIARAFDAGTGEQVWETRIPGAFRDEYFSSSFAVADGVAAVLCDHFVGLDTKTGQLLWEGDTATTRGIYSSPAVWNHEGKSFFIVNVNRNETIAVEPRTGRELWRERTWSDMSTPVIVGDIMVTQGGSRRGGVRRYDLALDKPTLRWTYTELTDEGSSPIVIGEHIYAQGGKTLACLGLGDGAVKWQTQLDREKPRFTSMVAADGKLLYTHSGFLLFAADPQEYRPLADARFLADGLLVVKPNTAQPGEVLLDHASPAIAGGRLYVRMLNHLACYDLRARAAN